jgi:hypothetical protein
VRLPQVPSTITGEIARYLGLVVKQLNGEAYISKFSGSAASLSAITGIPGDLVMNVGSASTATRLWIHKGSTASADTINWSSVRIALG